MGPLEKSKGTAETPTNQWHVLANATAQNAVITDNPPGMTSVGNHPQGVPAYLANLWSTCKFSIAGTPGFMVGAGLNYQSTTYRGHHPRQFDPGLCDRKRVAGLCNAQVERVSEPEKHDRALLRRRQCGRRLGVQSAGRLCHRPHYAIEHLAGRGACAARNLFASRPSGRGVLKATVSGGRRASLLTIQSLAGRD